MTMTDQSMAPGPALSLPALAERAVRLLQAATPLSFVQLVTRVALAVPFWRSGILKWDGFLRLSDTAVTLFSDEFMLHLPGGPYHFPVPTLMAFLSGCGEVGFPVLLILGLGTRFAALGLLFMTCIVELTVPDGWPIHLTWAAMALTLIAHGGGKLSLDHVLGGLFGGAHQGKASRGM
ncbi:DoxX family protein [Bradyrhizobium sp. HKCCYLS2038]|uniref:DoxX family protein n=1 Tax=unclassified Bradyrhizobium TaxID=2631580 RepID=UPI003EC116B5